MTKLECSARSVPGVKVAGQVARPAVDRKRPRSRTPFLPPTPKLSRQPRTARRTFRPGDAAGDRQPGGTEQIADALEGHLTATIHGTAADLESHANLVDILRAKGRPADFQRLSHRGGSLPPPCSMAAPIPPPPTPRTTSVGTAAIERFVRPICYQDFPQSALPAELQEADPARDLENS